MSSSPRGKRKEKALSTALFSLSGILPNFFFSFNIYLFIWPHWASVAAGGI